MAVSWRKEWRQGSKGGRRWQDKGRYGWVVVEAWFYPVFSASISALGLAILSGIVEFLRLSGMAGINSAKIQ
jgi:hypothetical protein